MATLVLQTAGQALGGLFGPLGGIIGRAAGAIAGNVIDQTLFGPPTRHRDGPRLSNLYVQASTEGAPVPRAWGRMRIAGQIIWATQLEEVVSTSSYGGKGVLSGPSSTVTSYDYFANFAIGLAEGPIARIGRVWADGKEIDLDAFTWRFYQGDETQEPDSFILAKEGADAAPAYRGLAYVVLEQLPLAQFGNRVPQFSFEIFHPLESVEGRLRAVCIIPGSTEFGYEPEIITRNAGWGETESENAHASALKSDWTVSFDQLTGICPNVSAASLVVAWFGDDLRCGVTSLRPGVETADKQTAPLSWSVAGLTRGDAHVVSQSAGSPAFGGTPSDQSVIDAIADLKARGLEVVFYPFILMDIAQGNGLPDPYGGSEQAVYPWRGRITCDPAPGEANSPDKTAALTADVDHFFGAAQVSDFSTAGGAVIYSGPGEWGLRRMVLHYAHLCALAGGVDVFVIASELRGLTTLRESASSYPAVARLKTLAEDVKTVLPGAKVSYGADWSEYFGHQPADGSGDVFFHLDSLWASTAVDFIGIDNYLPLSDWRPGAAHVDAEAGWASVYDPGYLTANIAGGEYFDWYYASNADRLSQQRTTISDGAYGKPWVFRPKDLSGWWSNQHFERPGGVEGASPTEWVPQSKPIWFTELGIPAVDLGTNQPNVFYDPKSSESALPYFSSGVRDDLIQRQALMAVADYWRSGTGNPVSSVYGGPMVDPDRLFVWAWDARPFPAFPGRSDIWADAANYQRGHWLNGRLGAVSLDDLVADICHGYGFDDAVSDELDAVVDGYLIDRPMSARDAVEPLGRLFAFDGVESNAKIVFRPRLQRGVVSVAHDELVEADPDKPIVDFTRAQESELPTTVKVAYTEGSGDYFSAMADARRQSASLIQEVSIDAPCVLPQSTAAARAAVLLGEAWAGRESARFILPPDLLALEPGDAIDLATPGGERRFRIEEISDAPSREILARSLDPHVYEPPEVPVRGAPVYRPAVFGEPAIAALDLPLIADDASPYAPWMAAAALPWPGEIAVVRAGDAGYSLDTLLTRPAAFGQLTTVLPSGPLARYDRHASCEVKLVTGTLQSISVGDLLAGGNAAAVESATGRWEVLQFANAELIGERTYRLSLLLRGQAGSDPEMVDEVAIGSTFVLLDRAVLQLDVTSADLGLMLQLAAGPASRDPADASYLSFTLTPSGLGLRPLRPVHVSARQTGGDIEITWIRRSRIGADSWQGIDIPLGEDSEAYVLEILNGANVARQVEVTSPAYLYSAADRMADFGTPLPATLHVRVAQSSATYGPGSFAEKTFNV